MDRPTRRNQRVRWFPTPPPWLIRWATRLQVWVYEKSGGRLYTRAMRMHHLLLYTTGRRSGRAVVACLPYWIDADEHRIVVASMAGGTRNPAWYHNLRDRTANPQVRVRDKRQVFLARAGVLEGQEREAVWRELTQDRPFYLGYQEKCERPIPLVRLVRSRNSPVITTSDANSERPR